MFALLETATKRTIDATLVKGRWGRLCMSRRNGSFGYPPLKKNSEEAADVLSDLVGILSCQLTPSTMLPDSERPVNKFVSLFSR